MALTEKIARSIPSKRRALDQKKSDEAAIQTIVDYVLAEEKPREFHRLRKTKGHGYSKNTDSSNPSSRREEFRETLVEINPGLTYHVCFDRVSDGDGDSGMVTDMRLRVYQNGEIPRMTHRLVPVDDCARHHLYKLADLLKMDTVPYDNVAVHPRLLESY